MKSKVFLTSILILLLGLIGSWAFFTNYLSRQQLLNNKVQDQIISCNKELQKQASVASIEACKDREWQTYYLDWNNECTGLGLDEECDLPASLADKMDGYLNDAYERCVVTYSPQ